MNAPDTNLLLYAHNPAAPLYRSAQAYLHTATHGGEPFGIPVLCVQGFIRISTGIAFGANHLNLRQAFNIVDQWLESPNVSILHSGEKHLEILRGLAQAGKIVGPALTDAAIAAIVIEHDAVLHSADRDFARFPGLRWHNPLAQ